MCHNYIGRTKFPVYFTATLLVGYTWPIYQCRAVLQGLFTIRALGY